MAHHVNVPEINDMSQAAAIEMEGLTGKNQTLLRLTVAVAYCYPTLEDLGECGCLR